MGRDMTSYENTYDECYTRMQLFYVCVLFMQ